MEQEEADPLGGRHIMWEGRGREWEGGKDGEEEVHTNRHGRPVRYIDVVIVPVIGALEGELCDACACLSRQDFWERCSEHGYC